MGSEALRRWETGRQDSLEEIERARRAVGVLGRPYATAQLNQAYAVLLTSHFQAFCRDLHTEIVEVLVEDVTPRDWQMMVWTRFLQNRFLDRGNPTPGNLGSDLCRFGLNLWDQVRGDPPAPQMVAAQRRLVELTLWRNAIAHQDFTQREFVRSFPSRPALRVRQVRTWRAACHRLASRMDRVLAEHLLMVRGRRPW